MNRMWICIDAFENYSFYMTYWYNNFAGLNNILLSFFNGLLNNIISYSNLVTDMSESLASKNKTATAY